MIHCLNCGTSYDGKFCPKCGQRADTGKLSWHEIVHHAWHGISHTDRGLWYTLVRLSRNPGPAIASYISGKRINFFNPFFYLILIGGICSMVYISLGIASPDSRITLSEMALEHATLAYKYFAWIGLEFIVMFTLTDRIWDREKRFTLPEYLVANTFQAGHINFIVLLFAPLLYLQSVNPDWHDVPLRTLSKTCCLAFMFVSRMGMAKPEKGVAVALRILLQLVLIFLVYHFILVPTSMQLFSPHENEIR